MIAAKLLSTTDRVYAIPRHDWTSGTVYDYYRGDYGATVGGSVVQTVAGGTDMWATGTKMYVRSSANNVYLCVDNNGGGTSTVEPSGTTTSEFTTSPDDYTWKYMYSLTSAETLNFMSTDFIHASTDSTVSAAAVDGALDTIMLCNFTSHLVKLIKRPTTYL